MVIAMERATTTERRSHWMVTITTTRMTIMIMGMIGWPNDDDAEYEEGKNGEDDSGDSDWNADGGDRDSW